MYKKAILHFKRTDPIIYEAARCLEPFELTADRDTFVSLVRSIIGQQLSIKAASTIYGRFELLFKDKIINVNDILKLNIEVIRKCGISYPKVAYIKDLALKVEKKEVQLNTFSEMESDMVAAELIKIKGIGMWTAEMFLMFSLGRPDIFSYGDLGLQNGIKSLYKMRNKPTIKQMEKLSKKWIPYRTYAAMIIWDSLDNKPKYS